jgi:hypothetical protein
MPHLGAWMSRSRSWRGSGRHPSRPASGDWAGAASRALLLLVPITGAVAMVTCLCPVQRQQSDPVTDRPPHGREALTTS